MSDLQKFAGKVSSHLSISWTCDLRVIESGPVEIECVMELSSCLPIYFHHMSLSENRVPTSKQDEPSFSPIFKFLRGSGFFPHVPRPPPPMMRTLKVRANQCGSTNVFGIRPRLQFSAGPLLHPGFHHQILEQSLDWFNMWLISVNQCESYQYDYVYIFIYVYLIIGLKKKHMKNGFSW